MSETVLVTGASSGIGAALALRFAADGCRLVLTARSAEGLAATADRILAAGGAAPRLVVADLATPAGVAGLMADIADEEIDVLDDNAGAGLHGRAVALDREAQLGLVDLDVRAVIDLALRLLPGMVARRRGGILFVASMAGFAPGGPSMAVYYAAKAALLSFSDALAVECAGTGVTITALCPGPTATDFGRRAGFSAGAAVDAYGRMGAEAVAIAGHDGFRLGRRRVVPGWTNRVALAAMKLLPRDMVLAAIGKAQAARGR